MFEIKQIVSSKEKTALCERILRSLPSWFGNEQALLDYAGQCEALPVFAAISGDEAVGFVAVKPHNPFTAEVCVMGVLTEYHRLGIGRMLIERCERFCGETGRKYLTVKTLDASAESQSYGKTRLFYFAMGFHPLEVFPLLWDEANPCLFLVKPIKSEGV